MFLSTGAIASQKGRVNSTPNHLGEGINITGLNDVWRATTANNFIISVPGGYQTAYQIIEAESLWTGTPVIEKQGNNSGSISHTFTTASILKAYHIRVVITKGTLQFERWFVKAITVLPALFTEGQANAVWDFSAGAVFYRDNNLVDRTNYKIFCKGIATTGQYLGLEEWVSSITTQPVHILAAPGTVVEIRTSNVYTCRINQNCQNILLDGCGDPNIPYGFKFSMPGTGGRAQIFYIEASTNSGSTTATAGRNITVCGLELDGNGISSAGIKVDTANSATVNYNTYNPLASDFGGALVGLRLFKIKISKTVDEGLYCGYVSDSPHGSPAFASAPIPFARIYKFDTVDTGGDGIQLGASMFDAEVHHYTVTNAGTRNDPSHKNGVQFSSGNQRMYLFMGRVFSTKNLQSIATGLNGGDMDVFANIFENPTVDGNNHTNVFLRVDANASHTRIAARFFNNTYNLAQNRPFEGWNATNNPALYPKLDWTNVNNAIVADQLTAYLPQNSIDTTTWVFANYQVTNSALPQFVNFAGGDYRPASLSSPLFQSITPVVSPHPLAFCDYEGYKYALPIKGAFSGVTLQT